jgi:hypothetical protein
MRAKLTRISKTDKQTLGQLDVGDLSIFTLELPDLNNDGIPNNEVRKSCIPEGIYPVVRHNSPKFGETFWVKDVPGRSAILIHPGNYYYHTLGCILTGMDQKDMNKDGLIDNVSSTKAMEKLLEYDITELEVVTV